MDIFWITIWSHFASFQFLYMQTRIQWIAPTLKMKGAHTWNFYWFYSWGSSNVNPNTYHPIWYFNCWVESHLFFIQFSDAKHGLTCSPSIDQITLNEVKNININWISIEYTLLKISPGLFFTNIGNTLNAFELCETETLHVTADIPPLNLIQSKTQSSEITL